MHTPFQPECVRETSCTERTGYGFVEVVPCRYHFSPDVSEKHPAQSVLSMGLWERVPLRHDFSLDV